MKRRSVAALVGGSLAGLTGWDLLQRRRTILRNYPIIGHLRFLLEAVDRRASVSTAAANGSRTGLISALPDLPAPRISASLCHPGVSRLCRVRLEPLPMRGCVANSALPDGH
jgi:hypothetical protein